MLVKVHNCTTGEVIERDATPEEEARITTPDAPPNPRLVLDAQEAATAKLDAQVQQFLNMTPGDLDAWVDANITGTGPRTAFKVLGRLAQHAARGRILR